MAKPPLKQLALADPDLAEAIRTILNKKKVPVSSKDLKLLVNETLWGITQEIKFGQAVAEGYAGLIGEVQQDNLDYYRRLVRKFGRLGPTLGRIMAMSLVPVLKCDDHRMVDRFLQTFEVMESKGTYTLKDPFEALSLLLNKKEIKSALIFLDLLKNTFASDLSYVQSQHFAHFFPKTILNLDSSKRTWQLEQLVRVIKTNFHLADPFLEGLENGLNLLSKDDLDRFVSLSLKIVKDDVKLGAKYLSLESKIAIDTYSNMQTGVLLVNVQHQLTRYLRARTGLFISVRSLSALSQSVLKEKAGRVFICSDGKFIYLPDEIREFATRKENARLYKCLVKIESCLYEFGTFDFDFEKVMERLSKINGYGFSFLGNGRHGICEQNGKIDGNDCKRKGAQNHNNRSDMESFFSLFPVPELAADLFTVFEHGRLRLLMKKKYSGLVRQTFPLLRKEALNNCEQDIPCEIIFTLYLVIALDSSIKYPVDKKEFDFVLDISKRFETAINADNTVETCAEFVYETYIYVKSLLQSDIQERKLKAGYHPLQTPYGRRIRPDLVFATYQQYEQTAAQLKMLLKNKGIRVYLSEIRKKLIEKKGALCIDDIKNLICSPQNKAGSDSINSQAAVDLSWLNTIKLTGVKTVTHTAGVDSAVPVFWHDEWDSNLNDYLPGYVRVIDRTLDGIKGDFYNKTLLNYHGLVKKIRYAFDLLKPEGLVRLRQWIEGDEFDYRALLDYAMDKKAGKIPSDRLYIKHIKKNRDVAVLLLVDISRSTSNKVFNANMTVLDVEKEAIVLFCEALKVVGDDFSIAGFSGTSRLNVDYFRIKDFDENVDCTVKERINAISSQRTTRMGGAIRHATGQLEKKSSKVRILIIIGDGFPNDIDYKHGYAIADTRKALFEARSKNIYTHAITVNLAGDSRLDDLYGHVHHNMISDVRQLPDKLLQIYGHLTR